MVDMPTLDIALDIEGVLADTHVATRERSDLLTDETCPPHEYDFVEEEHYDEYMHVSQNLWHNHNHLIPPLEQPEGWDLGWATKRLSTFHNVDIVTSRTNVDQQVEEWLKGYNIHHDEMIVTDDVRSDKTEYGDWDVHIEDSPHVARDALSSGRSVFLIERAYNDGPLGIGAEYAHRVHRVSSVTAAVEKLCDPQWVTNQKGLVGPVSANART